jgi:hypothetical protein
MAQSKTKRLFQFFSFYTETEIFDVSIEPKQTETETVRYGAYFGIFSGNFGFFRFVLVCVKIVCFYTKTESFDVSIEPKQTEDQPKQFDREHILVFL